MSEMKIDNPAQRLLDLLEQGKQYQKADNCRKVWQQILQVEGMEEHHLLTRLAYAMALPGRIIQVREDNFSTLRGKSNHWKSRIDTAFVSQILNSDWNTFWNSIDDRTLTELGMLSDLFETRGAHAVIAADGIDSLLERIKRKRTARAVLTGMCYSAGSAMRHGSSSLTRLTGQSAMTPSTWRR